MRRFFQVMGLAGFNGYVPGFLKAAIYQGSLKQVCTPILNCYACPGAVLSCPVGSFQHFVIINQSPPYYLLSFLALIGMAVGRMMCGWACPFGLLQDLLHKVQTIKVGIPRAVTHAKYVVLTVVVFVVVYVTQEPWFSKLCPDGLVIAGMPFTLLSADIRSMIKEMFWIKLGILALVVVGSAMTKRPFCRTVCPVGTVYSYFNGVSFMQMTVDHAACTRCNRCQKVCPMDIRIWENTQSVDCIRCLECTRCPCVAYRPLYQARPAADGAAALPTGA